VALTGRAPLLALLGVLPVAVAPSVWTVLAVLLVLLVVVVADVGLAAPVSSLRLSRDGDTSVRQGEQAAVRLAIVNRGGRRAHGLLRDAWVPSAGAGPRTHDLDVPAGERRVLTTLLRPTRRGDRTPDRVTVRTLGPLGVAGRQGRHEVAWRLRVQPPFTSRRFLPERLSRLRQLDGANAVRARGQGTEFDSLREYVPGDDVRSIDWRGTARRSEVVVRTWRPERDRTVLLVLDTSRTSAGRVGDVPRLDAALAQQGRHPAPLAAGALGRRRGVHRLRAARAGGQLVDPGIADGGQHHGVPGGERGEHRQQALLQRRGVQRGEQHDERATPAPAQHLRHHPPPVGLHQRRLQPGHGVDDAR